MAIDPCRLRPTELCRLLNSTPLGEVINTRVLYRHREQAGLRIGEGRHVDLVRYVAWLVQARHLPRQEPTATTSANSDLAEAALAAAKLCCRQQKWKGHGQKFTRKHEVLMAALLTEPTNIKAAQKAGISERTLYRWLNLPEFQAAYRQSSNSLMQSAFFRALAFSGPMVDSLVNTACHGRRDSDRTRAAVALLNLCVRYQAKPDVSYGNMLAADAMSLGTGGVVKYLEAHLHQVQGSDLPLALKSRLTVVLSDALLRAMHEDETVKRQEAIQNVLQNRKEEKP